MHVQTGDKVAIKFEHAQTKVPQLLYESRLYNILHAGAQAVGIPQIKYFGIEGDYNVMVCILLIVTCIL